MKKYFYSVLAASMLFACSQEEIVDVNQSESQKVTFKVEVPGIATSRAAGGAIGAGTQADQLIYAMYEHGVENAPVLVSGVETDGEDNDGTFTVTVPMAKDIKYDLLFLAYNPSYPAFEIASTPDSTNLKALKFNAGQTPNVDAYDAFVGFLENNGVNETKTVTLKRPFAQINAATTSQDLQDAARLGATVKQSKLVITGVPTTYNVLSEEATGSQKVTYAPTDILNNETITVDGKTYHYLTLAYVLTNDGPSTHKATFEFLREGGQVVSTLDIPNLPIQRNYRTNIYGNLLTSEVDINVEIKPEYEKPDYDLVDAFVNQLAEGGLVTLKGDIVLNDYPEGLVITKNTEINLDGYTLTLPDVDASSRKPLITVDDKNNPVNLTVKNGKLVVVSTNGETNGIGTSTGGSQVIKYSSYGKLLLENVEITGSQRGGHRAIDAAYGEVELNNCKIDVNYGSAVNSNDAQVILNNCDITINGMYSAPYNSVCFSAMYGGEVTVNGGNYKLINNDTYATGDTHGGWVGIVMSSGGTIILNDGTFENVPAVGFNPAYERAIIEAENNAPAVSTVVFAGGKYKPQSSKIYSGYGDQYYPTWVNADKLTLGADGWYTVADYKGYAVIDGEYRVSTGAGLAAAVTDAPANAKITLTADVDLTGVNYTPRSFSSLVFDGQNYTISGVKVENANQAALFGKTWKFDIQNVTLANSIFTGQNIDGEDSAGGFIAFLQTYSGGSQIVNCHVKNCTIGSAKYVGGIVAYKDGEKPIKIDNCSVKDSKLVSKYTENGTLYKGHIGGLVGYLCGDNATSTVTNCVVENNTFEVLGARGGLFIGSAQADYNVSGKVEGNTGLVQLCGEVNKITNWNNVACTYVVSTTNDLKTALSSGGNIVLGGDVDFEKINLTTQTQDIVIDANGYTITTANKYGVEATAGKNITLKNAVVEITVNGDYINYAAGFKISNGDYNNKTIKLENCEIRMANTDWAYAITMPASVKNLNLVIDKCTLEGAIALQCWGDNNTITVTNSNLICNYTTSAMYTSYCVALQGDGTNKAENNTLNISGCTFSYSGVDNFNSKIGSVVNRSEVDTNTINVSDCTFNGVEPY